MCSPSRLTPQNLPQACSSLCPCLLPRSKVENSESRSKRWKEPKPASLLRGEQFRRAPKRECLLLHKQEISFRCEFLACHLLWPSAHPEDAGALPSDDRNKKDKRVCRAEGDGGLRMEHCDHAEGSRRGVALIPTVRGRATAALVTTPMGAVRGR